MKKKSVFGLVLVLSLVVAVASAQAYGPGKGRGAGAWQGRGGYGPAYGHHMGGGYGPAFDEETAKLQNEMYQKRLEMQALLAKPEVDAEKVKSLQAEMNKLHNDFMEKRLSAELEYRKNNPNQPYAYGPGYGRGVPGRMYDRGAGAWRGRGNYGPAYGSRMGGGYGVPFDEETAKLQGEMSQKMLEMRALIAKPDADAEKVKSLQAEINKLHNELMEKRVAADLEYRKNNPNQAYGYGPMGPGRMYGRGHGHGFGWR